MGRKKHEIANAVVLVSADTILDKLKCVEANKVNSLLVDHIQELLLCTSSISQIAVLREIGKIIPVRDGDMYRDLCVEVVAELYLTAGTGNPVKRAAYSVLEACPDSSSTEDAVSTVLKKSLFQESFCCKSASHVVDNITVLFTTSLGTLALQKCFMESFMYIKWVFKESFRSIHTCRDAQKMEETYQVISKAAKALSLALQFYEARGQSQYEKEVMNSIDETFPLFVEILVSDSSILTCKLSVGMLLPVLMKFRNGTTLEKVHCEWPDELIPCPPLAEVCFLNGLVGSLSSDELVSINEGSGALVAIDILERILNVHKRSEEASFLLTCAKTTTQWTNRAIEILENARISEPMSSALLSDKTVTKSLLQYVWSYWEHFIDAVSQQAQEVFKNVLDINMHILKDGAKYEFLEEVATFLLDLPWHRKGKYSALCHLADVYGCAELLRLKPGLVEDLLRAAEELAMCSYVKDLTKKLCVHHVKGATEQDFSSTWLVPFLSIVQNHCPRTLLVSLFQHILPVFVSCYPKTMDVIFENMSQCGDDLIPATLTCLLSDKSCLQTNLFEQWKDALLQGVCHRDEQVRLDALALLVEHPKSCEPVQPQYLELLRHFVHLNISVQSPAFQQQIVASMKKLLHRMYDSSSLLKKIARKSNNECVNVACAHQDFVSWLQKYCTDQLYPGANFNRRSTALQLLQLLASIQASKGVNSVMELKWTVHQSATLLQCLKDPYETNKVSALQLLRLVPASTLGFENDQRIHELFEAALQLSRSARPPDSVTAAYLLEFLADFDKTTPMVQRLLNEKGATHNACLPEEGNSATLLSCLRLLLTELRHQLEVAKGNIIEAASCGPMYGTLRCVRSLLSKVPWRSLLQNQLQFWQTLLDDTICIGFQVAQVVGPIVTNASPEGQLNLEGNTEILKQVQEALQKGLGRKFNLSAEDTGGSTLNGACDVDMTKALAVVAQMLLLCGWRAHREVSLLFGEICQTCPMSPADSESNEGPLSVKQVLSIGNFFMEEMSTIRHRGAFEQAFTAFVKMCHVLWRSKCVELSSLPATWISELMVAVEQRGLSATRRSAGIPFIVQALLVSEPAVLGSKTFHRAMQEFLAIAHPGSDSAVESKVHAINVLRALYRNAKLGDIVVPYVADGVKVALLGFKAESWAVRNSATLLFSALMTRIFGVNRSREEPQKKNCLTGHIFFLRYPSLFLFILEQLEGQKNSDGHKKIESNVYPILLMLARLYPSAVEGSFRLADFIPHAMHCATSPVWKVRTLAARALVPLLAPSEREHFVMRCFASLPEHQQYTTMRNNSIHGTLMQIEHILKCDAEYLSSLQFMQRLSSNLMKNLWLATSISFFRDNPCLVTRATFVNIISIYISNVPSDDFSTVPLIKDLMEVVFKDAAAFLDAQIPFMPGQPLWETAACNLLLHLGSSCSDSLLGRKQFLHIVEGMLNHGSHEISWTALKFVRQFLCAVTCGNRHSINFVPFTDGDISKSIYRATFLMLKNAHTKAIGNPACIIEACAVLNGCCDFSIMLSHAQPTLSDVLQLLTEMVEDSTQEAAACALLCLSCHVASQIIKQLEAACNPTSNEFTALFNWMHTLVCNSKPNMDFNRRLTASRALPMLANLLINGPGVTGDFGSQFWKLMVNFLQDDELPIREQATETAHYLVTALKFQDLPVSVFSERTPPDVTLEICIRLTSPFEAVQLLLDWMLTCQMIPLDAESDEHPFEKGELNTYSEEVVMTDLCYGYLCSLALEVPPTSTFRLEPDQFTSHESELTLSVADIVVYCLEQCSQLASDVFANATNTTLNRHADPPLIRMYQCASVAAALRGAATCEAYKGFGDTSALVCHVQGLVYTTEFVTVLLQRLRIALGGERV
ncbi:tRNA (32-2'-O)-methyltransferase regulator THADA-like isoform X3 [Ornithodoros turicata]|uniref:tRNA (32-2'-O)-methyltransferase regulator THADA-like isoform X3 n=1 Tax=Ornithodoros turicata TaxID=34597 RepID=UPI00313A28F5